VWKGARRQLQLMHVVPTEIFLVLMVADKKLFRQISNVTHCLHPLLPKRKKITKYLILPETAATNIHSHKLKQHYSKTVSSTDVYFLIFNVLRLLPCVVFF